MAHEGKVNTLCAQLSWSHIRQLMVMDDPLKRDLYISIQHAKQWLADDE